jgi:hypothetical protein
MRREEPVLVILDDQVPQPKRPELDDAQRFIELTRECGNACLDSAGRCQALGARTQRRR